jgi:para-aminobenzoate synthetase component 1
LDNHQYQFSPHTVECLLAVGAAHNLECNAGSAFQALQEFSRKHDDWMFGHFSYDLKNELEDLSSHNFDGVVFPDLHFYVPEIMIRIELDRVFIGSLTINAASVFNEIQNYSSLTEECSPENIHVEQRISKSNYLDIVHTLKNHIQRGDCYEINFCQEFFAEGINLNPLVVYNNLVQISPNPFSGYYRLGKRHLMCASPERYLKKNGNQILSQPMKGTVERKKDAWADEVGKNDLLNSLKERTENVMIVDLVRNDLSRVCNEGSVNVQELFGVYAFPQVYQMISTIIGELRSDCDWLDAIRSTFPMGSMTGAPKKRVMQLIEHYEQSRRGIFSGAIGYVTPEKDFDFNVVIRSIMFNQDTNYLSYQAGSAITIQSNAEKEYEECLLKVEAIKKVLTRSVSQHFQKRY